MNRFSSCGYRFYCKSISKSNIRPMDIKTFVFLDIETTGLPKMENNRTKITELCMVAIEASHIQMGVFPRVQNKLNFCFNPWKLISAESEKITGTITCNMCSVKCIRICKFQKTTTMQANVAKNYSKRPRSALAAPLDMYRFRAC